MTARWLRVEERTAKLKVDVPQLEAIVSKQWGKEDELKQLKSDLAALDRKITAALAPKKEEQDGEENKQDSSVEVNTTKVDAPSTANDQKKSMVAEPEYCYAKRITALPYSSAGFGYKHL